jgi:hypothetical protein
MHNYYFIKIRQPFVLFNLTKKYFSLLVRKVMRQARCCWFIQKLTLTCVVKREVYGTERLYMHPSQR